jgi:hypothetical protein
MDMEKGSQGKENTNFCQIARNIANFLCNQI